MTDVYGTQENVVVEPSRDDLTKIKGIGSTTAEKLYNAKIISVKQIAEMTPERLSETPGIGLATATKFITAAKYFLESSSKEEIVREPIQVQEEPKVESTFPSIEHYEIEEVIVEEVKEIEEKEVFNDEPNTETEMEENFDSSQTQEKHFSNKHNYSSLTASYPPISEHRKRITNPIEVEEVVLEEEELTVEPKMIQIPENIEFTTQPEIEQIEEYEKEEVESTQEIVLEGDEVELTSEEPRKIDFEYSKDETFESFIHQQISDTFKDAGCYEIPRSLESLKRFTSNLDYLGCKLVKFSNDVRILFLFPVKRFDREGTVLVDERKIELKSYPSKKDLGAYYDVEQTAKDLLQVRDSMYEDIANGQNVLAFFQKYLQINLSLEKGFGNKSAVFLSGATQYKVFIEPILLCCNPPRSMEKSLAFPYQRSTNLHAVTRTDLNPLVKFLEKKNQMIEKRTKKTSSIKEYRQAEDILRSSVRYASIPVFGYSATLLIVYFAELYFLLRLFNTIGFAVVGIYLSLLAFFYFRAYKTKKEFTNQFETPYYQQNLEFSETDLLDFKVELTDELLTQFGYECLEKGAKFGVIEQSETNALKQTVEIKRAEPEFKKMFEPEQVEATTVSIPTTKYKTKYQKFLEDS